MTATYTAGWTNSGHAGDEVDLVVHRCADCGEMTFPPTAERCPQCWSESLEAETVPSSGAIYSFTVVRRSFPDRQTPYVIGLVDLDVGLRVMAALDSRGGPPLAVGARVAAFRASDERNGLPATAYEFRPVG